MNKITDLTIDTIREGKHRDLIPEFYELEDAIEDGGWHINDSVFNHTLTVAEKLLEIMDQCSEEIKKHLNEVIGQQSRRDLLFAATLFHDIGKKQTMKVENGKTVCPNHEPVGAKITATILERFAIEPEAKEYILKIVKNHTIPHLIFSPENRDKQDDLKKLKNDFPDTWQDLLLHAMADTMGSQGETVIPNEYHSRIEDYKKILTDPSPTTGDLMAL